MDYSTIVRSANGGECARGRVSDDVTRRAASAGSRRVSFVTLGAATVAAAIARPEIVQAGKIARKARKRSQKKCKKQVDACRASLTALCGGEPECEADFLPCCSDLSDCKASKSLDCFFSLVN